MHALQKELILFNNHGASLLETNNAIQAAKAFQNGIRAIKSATYTGTSSSLNPEYIDIQNIYQDDRQPLQSLRVINDASVHMQYCFGSRVSGLQNELMYAFDRPLLLQPTTEKSPSSMTFSYTNMNQNNDDVESMIMVTMVAMVFNLALATHKLAIQDGTAYSIHRAIKIYNVAATILNGTSTCLHQYTHDIIYCVIMNNLACLHTELCDYDQCANDLQCVQDIFGYSDYTEKLACEMHLIQLEELVELKLNCAFGKESFAAKAA